MMAVTVLGFVGNILTLHWFEALFNFYVFILAIVVVVLESGQKFSLFARLESSLYRNALFLKYIWGRGIIHFVAGTIQISLRDLVDVVVGAFVCGVWHHVHCDCTSCCPQTWRFAQIYLHTRAAPIELCQGRLRWRRVSDIQFRVLTNSLGCSITPVVSLPVCPGRP
jgi:hypothetical protein